MGFPEMSQLYFHHCIDEIEFYGFPYYITLIMA